MACHERVLARHVTVTDPAHDRARTAARALAAAPTRFDDGRSRSAIWPFTTRPPPSPARGGGVSGARDLGYLCRELKAPSLLAGVQRLAERARADAWSHEDFLAACLEREVSARQSHGGEARIRAARFPARKTIEDFDFDHQRSVRADVVAHLGALDFIEARSNAVFLGPPGTGKTHLSIALGIRACLAGHRVAVATAAQWVDRLGAAHDAGRLQTELVRLGRVPLVIIDEVGYVPFQGEAANLFFQLVSSRYERASLIVSSKAFSRWGEVFGDDTVAAAMIDRLVHHAEVINLKGDSYRLKGRDLGRPPDPNRHDHA